jgi:hypothetical protein
MSVYMAAHVPFSKLPYNYIVPIFLGYSAEKNSYPGVTDHTGTHISNKNHIYSELTALYWGWKNTDDEYVGLCHYRRFFDITESEMLAILSDNQVILPRAQLLRWPVDEQFIRVHSEKIWNPALDILYKKYPEYISKGKKIFSDNRLYRYNMFIAKREFVEKYCSFVFDVLIELEQVVGALPMDAYQRRYAGFVSERLLTLYILGNDIPKVETGIIDADGRNISPGVGRQTISNILFKLYEQFA